MGQPPTCPPQPPLDGEAPAASRPNGVLTWLQRSAAAHSCPLQRASAPVPFADSPAGAPPPAAYPSFYLQATGPSCSGPAYAPPGVLPPGGPYPGYPDSNGAQPATAPYPPSPPAAYPSFAALPSQPGYPPPQSLQPPPQAQPSYSGALIQPQPTPGLRILPPLVRSNPCFCPTPSHMQHWLLSR